MIFIEIRSGCELYQEGGWVPVSVDQEVTGLNGMLQILDTESNLMVFVHLPLTCIEKIATNGNIKVIGNF